MGEIQTCKCPNNYEAATREQPDAKKVRAIVDLDYAGDTSHRKSVTETSIMMAGDASIIR